MLDQINSISQTLTNSLLPVISTVSTFSALSEAIIKLGEPFDKVWEYISNILKPAISDSESDEIKPAVKNENVLNYIINEKLKTLSQDEVKKIESLLSEQSNNSSNLENNGKYIINANGEKSQVYGSVSGGVTNHF